MFRKNAVIACAIACLVACSCFSPGSARICVEENDQKPWVFGAGWSFTWVIEKSPVIFERNTRMKFTVIEIRPVLSGSTVIARKLIGNLSRELNLGEKQWLTMKALTSYAEFDVQTEVYSLTADAIGDNMLVLPMDLAIPMWQFKIAYASRCNDTNWNITLDQSALIYDARNKTAPDERIRIDFNDKGIVDDVLMTYQNGTAKFHMFLESMYDPNSDFTFFVISLIFLSLGAGIAIIIALLFKKYKINARDLFKGSKRPLEPEDADPRSEAEKGDDF
ncbi:MAG: hypothetical protein Q6373_019595 [Candidatus Sigynarchaeota archaeon]